MKYFLKFVFILTKLNKHNTIYIIYFIRRVKIKKILFLFMCLFLVSCKPFDVNEVIDEAGNPFKEYAVI